jgi:hypothetical protein
MFNAMRMYFGTKTYTFLKMSAPATASAGLLPETADDAIPINVQEVSRQGITTQSNNAIETVTHTAALNALDPYFYSHFMRIGDFSWESSMPSNYKLLTLELNPFVLQPNLAYVMQMYNTWSGGFAFRLEIAGTGFNGGKILVVRVPPNMDPSAFNINSATVLNSVMMDVKMQGSAELVCEDYRQSFFHFTNRYGSATDKYGAIQNTAGNLVVYVMMPLISSAAGNGFVNVQYSVKLLPDFTVGQMIPPQLSNAPTIIDFDFLDAKFSIRDDDTGIQIPYMVFSNQTTSEYFGVDDLIPWSSTPITSNHEYIQLSGVWGTATTIPGQHETLNYLNTNTPTIRRKRKLVGFSNFGPNPGAFFFTDDSGFTTFMYYYDFSGSQIEYGTKATTVPAGANNKFAVVKSPYTIGLNYWSYANPRDTTFKTTSVVSTLGESLVIFRSDGILPGTLKQGYTLTGSVFNDVIREGKLNGYPDTTTIVFQVLDNETNSPLGYIRWWPNGMITTNAISTEIVFDVNNIKLTFYSFLSSTSKLPSVQKSVLAYRRTHLLYHKLSRSKAH